MTAPLLSIANHEGLERIYRFGLERQERLRQYELAWEENWRLAELKKQRQARMEWEFRRAQEERQELKAANELPIFRR